MILDMTLELFLALFFIASVILYYVHTTKKWTFRYWIIPVFVFYLLYLIKITIFPIFIFDADTLNRIREDVGEYFIFYQLKPLASIKNYFNEGAIIQLLGNIMLLMPLTCFVEIVTKGKINIKKEILFVSLTSVMIELIQLAINYSTGHPSRVADIDDIFLNIIGVIITVCLLRLIKRNKHICKVFEKVLYKR